ncbi:hypothetical protein PHYBLDRAFT_128295 [Phycomyces blakesleeanus NRRL 1555(-)]|uniref:SH3 domain-containing protein n=1 Tax=Phycomyces blakesleeanus (strain ATCC 8743b / DSM 1359 / FGSC 10004 / NBRC 33097 / NRRL 1555) TaxID=763407 RepID=A0A167K2X0_PHYB8|nr:hypothetical protein PHYBLDRAFT_128295 [Phycomyces blakesleeanus NRRL 1555(-)]OAD67159.1 hypothetical protein PHYBLDRAFT_128295 [Phycomyces blakesleeanus NRRL 1555(-)]|eukprot:XP_018285199.1 hypothetical protein PHYBLDRAFT_128295 [Phycomyces blakesleeanus NRRL 1555(-)]
MSLDEGEVVTNIDQVDDGWWFGVSEDGSKQGLFPANYVQVLEQEEQPSQERHQPNAYEEKEEESPAVVHAAQQIEPQAHITHTPAPVHQDEENKGHTAVALYDYAAGEDNEISFHEHEIISNIEFVSEEWWQGLSPDGKTVGLFPANYVELQG